jgi:hypothetical protein
MGVRLNGGQKRWFRLASALKGWKWLFQRVIHVSGNRAGKTLGLALLVLWANHAKIGIRSDDWDSWFSLVYRWYHLGPTHPISLILYREMRELMKGTHAAQLDENGVRRKIYWSDAMYEEVKFDSQYPGFRLWNGSEIQFRTTDDKAKGIQGVTAHGVSVDEAALEPYLNEILDDTAKLRTASTEGPTWVVSTPDGINDFFELVEEVKNNGLPTEERVWEDLPNKAALCWSYMSDNVGYGISQEQYDFLIQDADEFSAQTLYGQFISPSKAFFSPREPIEQAWKTRLPDVLAAKNGHTYVIFWDPSVSSDPTVVIVLDVTSKPWTGVYFRRWEKPMSFAGLIEEMSSLHRTYSTRNPDRPGNAPVAVTGFDSTSMGGSIIRQQLVNIHPQRPLNFAGASVKDKALSDTRAALSRNDVIFPQSWLRLQREVFGYRRDDKKIQQDAVMALTGAIYIAANGSVGSTTSQPFQYGYRRVGRN